MLLQFYMCMHVWQNCNTGAKWWINSLLCCFSTEFTKGTKCLVVEKGARISRLQCVMNTVEIFTLIIACPNVRLLCLKKKYLYVFLLGLCNKFWYLNQKFIRWKWFKFKMEAVPSTKFDDVTKMHTSYKSLIFKTINRVPVCTSRCLLVLQLHTYTIHL